MLGNVLIRFLCATSVLLSVSVVIKSATKATTDTEEHRGCTEKKFILRAAQLMDRLS